MARQINNISEFYAYKKALAYWTAKDNYMRLRLKHLLDDSYQYAVCADFRSLIVELIDLANKPADFFITESEFRG